MQFWSQGSWQLTLLSLGWLAGHWAHAHSSGSAPSMGQEPTFSSAQRQTCTSSQTQQLAKKIQTSSCYKLKTCELNCFHWEKNFVGNIKSEVADRYLKFAEETKFQLTQVNWKSSLSSTTPIHPWLENFSASQPRSCWRMGKKETTGTSQALTAYSSALSFCIPWFQGAFDLLYVLISTVMLTHKVTGEATG